MKLNNIVPIGFNTPKPNQMAVNNPMAFKYKKGDKVTHTEYPGMYGVIETPIFFHETPIIGYKADQNEEGGYQEYLEYLQTVDGVITPYAPWYYINWVNATELEQEHDTSVGLESEDTLTRISDTTNNLERLR